MSKKKRGVWEWTRVSVGLAWIAAALLAGCASTSHEGQSPARREALQTDLSATRATTRDTHGEGALEFVVQSGHDAKRSAMSDDGRFLATGSDAVKVWELPSGRLLRTLPVAAEVGCLKFTPDGRLLLCGITGGVIGWATADWSQQFLAPYDGPASNLLALPDGTGFVAMAIGACPVLFDMDGKAIRGYSDIQTEVVLIDEGRVLLGAAAGSPILRGWSVASGKVREDIPTYDVGTTWNMRADAQGRYALWNGYRKDTRSVELHFIDLHKRVWLRKLSGKGAWDMAITPDGQFAFACIPWEDAKPVGCRMVIWDVPSGRVVRGIDNVMQGPSFSEDGTRVVVPSLLSSPTGSVRSSLAGMELQDIASGRAQAKVELFMGGGFKAKFSADNPGRLEGQGNEFVYGKLTRWPASLSLEEGDTLAGFAGDGDLMLVRNGTKLISIDRADGTRRVVSDVLGDKAKNVYSTNRRYVAFIEEKGPGDGGGDAHTTSILDLESGRIIRKMQGFFATAFSNSGSLMLLQPVGQGSSSVLVQETATGREVVRLSAYDNPMGAFSPDDRLVVSSAYRRPPDGRDEGGHHDLVVWEARTGRIVNRFGYWVAVPSEVVFNRDGDLLAVGGTGDIQIWDRAGGRLVHKLGTGGRVTGLSWNADGRYLACNDGALRVWDVEAEKLLYSFIGFGEGEYLTWTPDGYYMGSDKAIHSYCHVVKGNKTYGMDQFFEQFYNPAMVQARAMGLDIEGVNLNTVLTESPPPRVEILTPGVGPDGVVASPGDRIKVTVAARDAGGGVREIRVYHNGKRVGTGAWTDVAAFQLTVSGGIVDRGISTAVSVPSSPAAVATAPAPKPVPVPPGDKTETFEIQLLNGENVIRASAMSGEMIESEPQSIVVKHQGVEAKPKLHIVAVGVNEYRDDEVTDLGFAQSDAFAFAEQLTDGAPALFGNWQIVSLYNADATRDSVLAALRDLETKAGVGDMVVFYFAGHGIFLASNGRFYLVTHETEIPGAEILSTDRLEGGVSELELGSALMRIPALKQVLFLDACQSGGSDFSAVFREASKDVAVKRLNRAAGTWVFSASGKTEEAIETPEHGHGLFTYAVLNGMQGQADILPADGIVTLQEIGDYVVREVARLAAERLHQQVPQVQRGRDDFALSATR